MRVYVGVTDDSWYRFLVARPHLTEVNFWMPGGGKLNMKPGEAFAFKLHKADGGAIVGGGRFDGSLEMPLSDAWRLFEHGNGVGSIEEMRAVIGRYRKRLIGPDDDPRIGCALLSQVVFLPPSKSLSPPADWADSLVRGKYYPVSEEVGDSIVEALLAAVIDRYAGQPQFIPGVVFGADQLARTRLGQRPFQALVLDAYHKRCAITCERIRPVLEAAHILPVGQGGANRLDNGLLLRSDVHTLFDAGYLGVDPRFRLMVSPRLRTEFSNGDEFYARAGSPIDVPDRRVERPHRDFLEWHADSVFRRT